MEKVSGVDKEARKAESKNQKKVGIQLIEEGDCDKGSKTIPIVSRTFVPVSFPIVDRWSENSRSHYEDSL